VCTIMFSSLGLCAHPPACLCAFMHVKVFPRSYTALLESMLLLASNVEGALGHGSLAGHGPPMNMSQRREVDANAALVLPRFLLYLFPMVWCSLPYEPGPTCAEYSSSMLFRKR